MQVFVSRLINLSPFVANRMNKIYLHVIDRIMVCVISRYRFTVYLTEINANET